MGVESETEINPHPAGELRDVVRPRIALFLPCVLGETYMQPPHRIDSVLSELFFLRDLLRCWCDDGVVVAIDRNL